MDHCSASETSEHDEHRGRQPGIRAPSGPEATSGPFDHPVYKKLAVINGEINKLTKQQMVEKLAELHLDTRLVAAEYLSSISIRFLQYIYCL